jgi:Suppressor of fused protein (SUFU)
MGSLRPALGVTGWLRRAVGRSGHDPQPHRSPGQVAHDEYVNAADGGPETERVRPRSKRRRPAPVEEVTVHEIREPHHWHLVTYGLSDLDGTDFAGPGSSGGPGSSAGPGGSAAPGSGTPGSGIPVSGIPGSGAFGWGFELTFRIEEQEPPLWAADLLVSLAGYVWTSGHPFAEGHNVDLRGPIRLDRATPITAAMIVEDPVLRSLDGPVGPVQFLQVVGLTGGELELCRAWTTDGVRDLLARSDPLLVTRLDRSGVDDDPRWAEEIMRRRAEEGSSLHELRVATLQVYDQRHRGIVAEMGAGAASALGPALRRELLAVGATFSVIGDDCELRFVAADAASWSWAGTVLEIAVPVGIVEDLAALFDGRTGWRHLPAWAELTFRVVD